jgi:hypothetical protein
MDKRFDIIFKTRNNFLNLVNSLTIEQLNTIPTGFNNNIAWNFGHIIVTQQILCYTRAGLPVTNNKLVEKYQKGTRPETFIGVDEITLLKSLLLASVEKMVNDYATGVFKTYIPFLTSYGVEIKNQEDAIHYLPVHDALHYGYSLALKRNTIRE